VENAGTQQIEEQKGEEGTGYLCRGNWGGPLGRRLGSKTGDFRELPKESKHFQLGDKEVTERNLGRVCGEATLSAKKLGQQTIPSKRYHSASWEEREF